MNGYKLSISVFLVFISLVLLSGCVYTPAGNTSQYDTFRTMALEKDPASSDALRRGLISTDPVIRRLAVYGLQRIGDKSAGAAIAPLLKDKNTWVVRTAATALGELRCDQQADALTGLLNNDDVMVCFDAFLALGRIGKKDTAAAMLKAMTNRRLWTEINVWDQIALLHNLERPWFEHPGAEAFLVSMLEYPKWEHSRLENIEPSRRRRHLVLVAAKAAAILAQKYNNPAGEDLLIEFLGGGDHDAQEASTALAAIKSRKAVAPLTKMLEGRWAINRRYALKALGEIGDKSALPAIDKYLVSKDIRVRRLAGLAYEKISGEKLKVDMSEPPAAVTPSGSGKAVLPGGKRPPMFICLGVDDCVNIEGLEAMLDIVETLAAHDRKVVFTMWVAPLAGDYKSRDLLKQTIILQRLFDLGSEIAHHTLHHNPGGHAWRSLPKDQQIVEIEGCTQWYRDNITGFTVPFTHKGGGGGVGGYLDRDFTRELLARQNFIYGGSRAGDLHSSDWSWPKADKYTRIPVSPLDAAAPPVHAELVDTITSDYPGVFDYEIADGVKMFMANLDYRYGLEQRTPVCVNAFHDWGFKDLDDATCKYSHRNQGAILKQFLVEALVNQSEKYPETHCVTYRQLLEYIRTGDLERTLAIGNGQDSRNPLTPALKE